MYLSIYLSIVIEIALKHIYLSVFLSIYMYCCIEHGERAKTHRRKDQSSH